MHEVLVNRIGGLSLLIKSEVRLTDCPDITIDVHRGRKTTQQQQNSYMDKKCYSMLQMPPKAPHTWNLTTGNNLDTRKGNLSHTLDMLFLYKFASVVFK